jgi:hypothetical protein
MYIAGRVRGAGQQVLPAPGLLIFKAICLNVPIKISTASVVREKGNHVPAVSCSRTGAGASVGRRGWLRRTSLITDCGFPLAVK